MIHSFLKGLFRFLLASLMVLLYHINPYLSTTFLCFSPPNGLVNAPPPSRYLTRLSSLLLYHPSYTIKKVSVRERTKGCEPPAGVCEVPAGLCCGLKSMRRACEAVRCAGSTLW
jgi:hypothetical protein